LNEQRYVKQPKIMKAKKKPLDTVPLAELEIEISSQFQVLDTQPPPERSKGIMVGDVGELVAELEKRGLARG